MAFERSRATTVNQSTFNDVAGSQIIINSIFNFSSFAPQSSHRPSHSRTQPTILTSDPDTPSQSTLLADFHPSDIVSVVDNTLCLIIQIRDLLGLANKPFALGLKSLHQILTLTRFAIEEYNDRPLGESLANAITSDARQCCRILQELHDKVAGTWELNLTRIYPLFRSGWRVRWAGDELALLKKELDHVRFSLIKTLLALNSVAWMQSGNGICASDKSLEKFHGLLNGRLSSLGRIQVNTVKVVDHLGRILPVPTQFCSTWKDFNFVINGYCRNNFGSTFVERGHYEVLRNEDSQIIDRSKIAIAVESGTILEMCIIMRQMAQTKKEKCPRCGYINLGITPDNGWIECSGCPGKFQVAPVDEQNNEHYSKESGSWDDFEAGLADDRRDDRNNDKDRDEKIDPTAPYVPQVFIIPGANNGGRHSQPTKIGTRQGGNNENPGVRRDDDGTRYFRRIHLIPERHYPRNVIVFGSVGVGKTSIINMLAGAVVARPVSSARGVILESTAHDIEIGGYHYQLHDIAELDDVGQLGSKEVIDAVHKLLDTMDGGINLLVYVLKGRLDAAKLDNYRFFYEIFCQKQVPIVLVVTGLEEERDLDDWWSNNAAVLKKYGTHFDDHACITSTRGKWIDHPSIPGGIYPYEQEYIDSKKKVEDCLIGKSLRNPWKMERASWTAVVFKGIWNRLATKFGWGWDILVYSRQLYTSFRMRGYGHEDAMKLSSDIVTGCLT